MRYSKYNLFFVAITLNERNTTLKQITILKTLNVY